MVSISEVEILILHRIKIISIKTKLQAIKLGHLDEKTAKNGYLYVQFSQKLLFKVKKSHSLNAAHDQKTSLAQKKNISHGNFTRFRF